MFKYALFGLLLFAAQVSASDPYKLADKGDYEASDAILKTLKPSPAEFPKYAFYRGVNAFAMNNKEEAQKWLNMVWDTYEGVPTRYKNTAGLMLNDLDNWKKDDLGDISRDMKMSGAKLANAYGGPKTQKIQKDIVDKLDKLIKDQEDKANAQAKANGKDADGNPLPMQGPGGQGQPAQDSHVMGGSGAGKVDDKQLRKVAESWGTMPPAQRAKIVQDITRDLPAKYKPMIDEYFKALNRMHHNK